jgi:hypothetical protein
MLGILSGPRPLAASCAYIQLNPLANTSEAVKINEINPKYENTRKLLRLLTNPNPGFLYKV